MASSVSLASALFELPLLVDHLSASGVEPDSAADPMDSITPAVEPLPPPFPVSSPQVHIQAALPSLLTLIIGSGLPVVTAVSVNSSSWVQQHRLWLRYQPGDVTTGMWTAERLPSISIKNNKAPPFMSVFQDSAVFPDRLAARRFVLGMRLNGHEFLMYIGGRSIPTACSGLLRC